MTKKKQPQQTVTKPLVDNFNPFWQYQRPPKKPTVKKSAPKRNG